MAEKSPQELIQIDLDPPRRDWRNPSVDFESRRGTWSYPAAAKNIEYMGYANPREWSPTDDDWQLPDNWQQIIHEGFKERLAKYRSLRVFMDTCVRCGACADKCHFFIGSGDPKNMPVLRSELLRSIYRNDFTLAGKLLGGFAGGRKLTKEVLKEWFYYFFQCTECRRCSVYCPYGIDTADVTMMARELMMLVGLNINWICEPVANCQRTGNHLGIQPHTFKDNIEFLCEELEDSHGIKIEPVINKKGAEVLFIIPSADYFADPGTYTFVGYLMLFKQIGLDYTMSAYASEGGNFGLFTSHDTIKKLNYKIYHEAKRLGVKWILGGECGHMWRVMHQYMDTMNGPADFLEVPRSPLTGTVFENARATKMVHICEFTADLIRNKKIKLDKSRNDKYRVTFHDSCNPARALGLFEEPRYILKNVCNHFYEMPENTIREHTFCCAGGAGLGNDENMEMRLRGGLPRGNALKHVRDAHGVNLMSCICAIDRATLPPLAEYWSPGVEISGVHELVANALVMDGEPERTVNLRGEPLKEEKEGTTDV
ncbi:MAG: (Fe-S)-binding protein [Thermoanaerobaculales bacterium]|jgi:Fe-S oxidoreductase|nr:(Fe-S)-binding protein [Thermoanaerobaculales bacterium]